ncbi:MAG TPA: hypothetical protein PKI11_13970 [Candidatus Hydrogenedentes bacterium]|nr:hypothetical protein [Candidatus Hydrogenedentota bacterium]
MTVEDRRSGFGFRGLRLADRVLGFGHRGSGFGYRGCRRRRFRGVIPAQGQERRGRAGDDREAAQDRQGAPGRASASGRGFDGRLRQREPARLAAFVTGAAFGESVEVQDYGAVGIGASSESGHELILVRV